MYPFLLPLLPLSRCDAHILKPARSNPAMHVPSCTDDKSQTISKQTLRWDRGFKKTPPGRLCVSALNAALEQADNFPREVPEINENSLVCFEALKLLLSHLKNVQKLQVLLTRKEHAKNLGHSRQESAIVVVSDGHKHLVALPGHTLKLWLCRLTPDNMRMVSWLVASSLSPSCNLTGTVCQ